MDTEQPSRLDPYWGRCPHCMQPGTAMVDIGRSHWAYCEEDKTRWQVGENLFSSWHGQTEEQATANAERLAPYQDVSAVYEVTVAVVPVIKFNNTGSYAQCIECRGVGGLAVGAQIFDEGSYNWICDNCLEGCPDAEMRVWRNRIHGWPDDMRVVPD